MISSYLLQKSTLNIVCIKVMYITEEPGDGDDFEEGQVHERHGWGIIVDQLEEIYPALQTSKTQSVDVGWGGVGWGG